MLPVDDIIGSMARCAAMAISARAMNGDCQTWRGEVRHVKWLARRDAPIGIEPDAARL